MGSRTASGSSAVAVRAGERAGPRRGGSERGSQRGRRRCGTRSSVRRRMESRGGSTSRRGGRRPERSRRSAAQPGWCVRLLLRVEVLALFVHALTIPYSLQVSCARSSTLPPPKFSSPFLPSLAFSPAQAARGRFRQRFEWLNRLPQLDGAVQGAAADWAAYRGERDRLDELEVRAVPLFAQPSL